MSPDNIRLIDNHADMQQNPCHSRNVTRGLTRAVRRYLMADSRIPVEEAATYSGACLEPSAVGADPCGAYAILKRWYRHASARAPTPSRTDMEKVGGGGVHNLYQREVSRPPGLPLLTRVNPSKVND